VLSQGKVLVKKWTKTNHALVFRMTNSLVQVYFKDGTEMFINPPVKTVTYINKKQQIISISNSDVNKHPDENIKKRLIYVKEILTGSKPEQTQAQPASETPP
jgi:hypothetical protein